MFTLSQALEAIKEKPEFKYSEKDGYDVIDYYITNVDTFVGKDEQESHILRNLRGAIFDKNGKMISNGFHKFHNLNECDGYRDADVDLSQPHDIFLKLDGSMIRPVPFYKEDGSLRYFRLGTRAGITDVAMMAENWMTADRERNDKYVDFINSCLIQNWIPIFEYCSRENRVVIDYPESDLILTAARNIETGEYLEYAMLQQLSVDHDISLVRTEFPCNDVKQLSEQVRGWKHAEEGVVISFDNGFKVKIKSDDYVLKHKTLDGLRFEKDVLRMVIDNTIDDILPVCDQELQDRLNAYRAYVTKNIKSFEQDVFCIANNLFDPTNPEKTRADYAESVKQQNSIYRSFLFRWYDSKPLGIQEHILKCCSSSTGVNNVRHIIGEKRWDLFQ